MSGNPGSRGKAETGPAVATAASVLPSAGTAPNPSRRPKTMTPPNSILPTMNLTTNQAMMMPHRND